MVVHDTPKTIGLFCQLPVKMVEAIFRDGLRLSATLKG